MTAAAGRRPILLAGRTAAIEWASLLLRSAGHDVRLLARAAGREGVTVRAAWTDNAATAYGSLAEAAGAAVAVLADLDDREAWSDPASLCDGTLPCPAVALSAFGTGPDAPRGSDLAVSAASGVLHLTGASQNPEGRPPCSPSTTARRSPARTPRSPRSSPPRAGARDSSSSYASTSASRSAQPAR